MNSNRAPIHAGDTVETPLLNIAGLDNQPVSPYPLTSTLMSSHSTGGLSTKAMKVDSGFSEQHGMSENMERGGAQGNSNVRETVDSHLHSQQSDELKRPHQYGKTHIRPNSSNLSSSSNKAGNETVSILRRPHTASAVLGHSDAGSCGSQEDVGQQRKKKRHNVRVEDHHHGDCEGVVLVNEHVLDGTEEEEEVEVPDESVGLTAATSGAMPQPNGYQPISAQ